MNLLTTLLHKVGVKPYLTMGSHNIDGLAMASRYNQTNASKINNKKVCFGFVNQEGTEVVECKYDSVNSFIDGYACVRYGDYWGVVDVIGTEVIECKYEDIFAFRKGLAWVKLDGKWGGIDITGKEIIPCTLNKPLECRDPSLRRFALTTTEDRNAYLLLIQHRATYDLNRPGIDMARQAEIIASAKEDASAVLKVKTRIIQEAQSRARAESNKSDAINQIDATIKAALEVDANTI